MISQAQSGSFSHGTRNATATRTKNKTPASEISRRASCGKGTTAMRTVPTATSAKTGSRTRMEPENPMGRALPAMVGSRRPAGAVRLWASRSPAPRPIPVTEAPDGLNRGVITVVPAQLAPKTQHGVLDPRGGQSAGVVPGQFDQLIRRQHLPLMPGERGQQAVLGRREDHRVAVDRDFLVGEVDVEGAVVEGDDRVVSRTWRRLMA